MLDARPEYVCGQCVVSVDIGLAVGVDNSHLMALLGD